MQSIGSKEAYAYVASKNLASEKKLNGIIW